MFKKLFCSALFGVIFLSGCDGKVVLEEPIDLHKYDDVSFVKVADTVEHSFDSVYLLDNKYYVKLSSNVEKLNLKNVYLDSENSLIYVDEKTGYNYNELDSLISDSSMYDKLSDIKPSKKFVYVGSGYEIDTKKSSSGTTKTTYDFESYFHDKSTNSYYEANVFEDDSLTNLGSILGKGLLVNDSVDVKAESSLFGDKYYISLDGYDVLLEKTDLSEVESNLY